ncbi:hypothetical protein Ddye_027957 [Dipteronia dyeriana]|uniref:Nudix hydrolase domain-containing protein n=1 Tax=Dipteronia dyeriana TaxID=168575 RepID=A0AAD9TQ44_9ROSI|nr:hypothetical protein Ddye_027957 [Dipteronia dyeriana]
MQVFENGVVELEHVKLLEATNDEHGGVIVEMVEPMAPQAFATVLTASMLHWKHQGKRGVWIKLPINLVNLVETAVKAGFWYHHAEPNYLMLNYWIPETANTLPANASHRVSVGAIVLNDKRELLVVREKSGKFQAIGLWKIPTGIVDEGEDISKAAMREVKEETGIDTEFLEILSFRQSHNSFFGKSGLFFLCMLRPLSFDIQKQEQEIEAAQEVSKTNDQLLPTPTTACVDCSICPYTCQNFSPPPPGYPLYGAPPPPSYQGSGEPSNGGATPPPKAKANCPPVPPVQSCCGNDTNTPPLLTGLTPPPSPYTYLPNHGYSAALPCYTIVILLFSFTVLF